MIACYTSLVRVERIGPDRLVVSASYPYQSALCAALLSLAAWGAVFGGDLPAWKRWVLMGGTVVCGLVLALVAEWSTFVFDRQKGTCRWSRRGWYGMRAGEWPLASIKGAAVETMASDQYGKWMHRLVLRTPDGPVPIGRPFEHEGSERLSEIGRSIVLFLKGDEAREN